MRAPADIPRSLLGPTQRIFWNSQGRPSTHLNIVTEHPLLPGRQTMIPMLVPGQIELGRLLEGQPATQSQYRRAVDYARGQALQGALLPSFDTVPDALAYEQQWRQDVIPQLESRMPSLRALMNYSGSEP